MLISQSLFQDFSKDWNDGKYAGQRYGQAFFNHFYCHKVTGIDREALDRLYNMPSNDAKLFVKNMIDHMH